MTSSYIFRWKQGIHFVFQRKQKIRTLLLSEKSSDFVVVVHLQGLEPWAHWLREKVAGSSQKMEVSSHRHFYAKQRDFLRSNFCTLCRILHRKVPSARFETVQKPCKNRALTPKQTNFDLSPTDLTALVWVTEHQNSKSIVRTITVCPIYIPHQIAAFVLLLDDGSQE